MITWDDPDERFYHTGLNRGVLYPSDSPAVAWNGLTGFDEGGETSSTILYRDGQIYMVDVDASDFSGKLTTFFYPEEFSECLGLAKAATGLYVDNQRPKRFSFSYRTLIGQGGRADPFGYQIHLVYNAIASIAPRTRKTLSDTPALLEFSFDLQCVPVKLTGFRPSAHYIIDTRGMDPATITEVENILYGTSYGNGLDIITPTITEPMPGPGPGGRMPTPTELLVLMS